MARASSHPFIPGLEPPPPTGVFFAVVPDAEAVAGVKALTAKLRSGGIRKGWRPERVLHVSLQSVGPYRGLPKNAVAAAIRAGAAVRMPPFQVTFDRIARFGPQKGRDHASPAGDEEPDPVVLCCSDGTAALTALRDALGDAMQAAWLRPQRGTSFTPHLTVLYSREPVPEGPLATPITATVRSFALVQSVHGETRHTPLGRWSLRD